MVAKIKSTTEAGFIKLASIYFHRPIKNLVWASDTTACIYFSNIATARGYVAERKRKYIHLIQVAGL